MVSTVGGKLSATKTIGDARPLILQVWREPKRSVERIVLCE